jgi:hypothetical protein
MNAESPASAPIVKLIATALLNQDALKPPESRQNRMIPARTLVPAAAESQIGSLYLSVRFIMNLSPSGAVCAAAGATK